MCEVIENYAMEKAMRNVVSALVEFGHSKKGNCCLFDEKLCHY